MQKLYFKSRQEVKLNDRELYLGGQIRVQYNTSYEIGRRVALGEASYKDLKRFFYRKLSYYRKFQIYYACIATKVLYGLETLNITLGDLHRLQIFEQRTIRRILRIPVDGIIHAYIY